VEWILNKINKPVHQQKFSKCIECECGSKIKLSYDINEMGNAIVAHAQKHAKTKPDKTSVKAEASRIEDLLIAKVFKATYSVQKP
jgi:hypothetical protein